MIRFLCALICVLFSACEVEVNIPDRIAPGCVLLEFGEHEASELPDAFQTVLATQSDSTRAEIRAKVCWAEGGLLNSYPEEGGDLSDSWSLFLLDPGGTEPYFAIALAGTVVEDEHGLFVKNCHFPVGVKVDCDLEFGFSGQARVEVRGVELVGTSHEL